MAAIQLAQQLPRLLEPLRRAVHHLPHERNVLELQRFRRLGEQRLDLYSYGPI